MAVRKAKLKAKPRKRVARRPKILARRARISRRHAGWEDLLPRGFAKEARRAFQTPALVAGAALVVVATLFTLAQQPSQTPQIPPDPVAQAAHDELDRALAGLRGKPIAERVAYWATNLTPEWANRLRGLPRMPKVQDIAPLIPPNFDCTTFVETVISLARSARADEFFYKLMEVRYRGGQNGFFDRNHFPEADWIPNNIRLGFLSDVTREVAQSAGVEPKSESKSINRASWFALQLKKGEFRGLDVTEPVAAWKTPVSVNLPYLSLEDSGKYIDHLPSGSVVNIVRSSSPKQWVLITHQAVVVRNRGVTYLRHSTRDGRIHTTVLSSYLQSVAGAQWPIVGLNVLAVAGE